MIYFGIYAQLLPLQAEFGIRALLVIPSYVLISLGAMAFWVIIFKLLRPRKLSLLRFGTRDLTKTLTILLVVALLLANGAFGASQSGVYFNPYISTSSYNKILQATNYVTDQIGSVPIFVFDGSIGHASLYRSYASELIGENFAYYGTLSNLLQLRPTVSNSSDSYFSESETSLSQGYLAEMSHNVTVPSPFIHTSFITNNSTLNSHTIVFITPELDNDILPNIVDKFLIGNGIYVVPPLGLAGLQGAALTSTVTPASASPILAYPPIEDIIALSTATLLFVIAISLFDYHRDKKARLIGDLTQPIATSESH